MSKKQRSAINVVTTGHNLLVIGRANSFVANEIVKKSQQVRYGELVVSTRKHMPKISGLGKTMVVILQQT